MGYYGIIFCWFVCQKIALAFILWCGGCSSVFLLVFFFLNHYEQLNFLSAIEFDDENRKLWKRFCGIFHLVTSIVIIFMIDELMMMLEKFNILKTHCDWISINCDRNCAHSFAHTHETLTFLIGVSIRVFLFFDRFFEYWLSTMWNPHPIREKKRTKSSYEY